MSVKKIFMTLITVVAMVMIGAFVLNLILPNASKALVNSVEQMIFNATGMSFDFNADGQAGTAGGGMDFSGADDRVADEAEGGKATEGNVVEGFN